MYFRTTLFTGLLLVISTTYADSKPVKTKIGPWHCSLAADGSGLVQNAYCCDEHQIDRTYDDGRIIVADNCTAVPEDQNVQCAYAANVWCCYAPKKTDPSIPDKWVCTSVAKWKPK